MDTARDQVESSGNLSTGKVTVHNAEWFLECMHAADWTPDDGTRVPRAPKQVVVERKSRLNAERAARLEKQRTAFAGKQIAREEEFRQQFEDAKREQERRRVARTVRKEAELEQKFEDFSQHHSELISSVAGPISELDTWKRRRRERLYEDWVQQVFDPAQSRIDQKLSQTTPDEVEARRCAMFEAFLNETRHKPRGIFRDIIDDDYDPIKLSKGDTLRYTGTSSAVDPTMSRGDREASDSIEKALAAQAIESGCAKPKWAPAPNLPPRSDLSVDKWHQISTTPYGRYNGDKLLPSKPGFNASTVAWNHYEVPVGKAANELMKAEFGLGGKRIVRVGKPKTSGTIIAPAAPDSAGRSSAPAGTVLPSL